jgi:hypothetical protein
VPNLLEVRLALGILTRVHDATLSKQNELVEHGHNVAAGLMNCKDDRALIFSRQCDKALDYVVRIVRVKA